MYKEKENSIHWRFSRAAITFFATYPIGSGWLTRERWLAQTCPLCMPIAQLVPRCRYVGPRPSKLQGVATYWRYCFTVYHYVEIFFISIDLIVLIIIGIWDYGLLWFIVCERCTQAMCAPGYLGGDVIYWIRFHNVSYLHIIGLQVVPNFVAPKR